MNHITAARHAILDLGSEDYYHLADAAVYLPGVPEDQRHAVALEALLQLVDEGLVEISYGRLATNEMSPVPNDQVRSVLLDPEAWNAEVKLDKRSYGFTNTERGDALYYSGATAPPK